MGDVCLLRSVYSSSFSSCTAWVVQYSMPLIFCSQRRSLAGNLAAVESELDSVCIYRDVECSVLPNVKPSQKAPCTVLFGCGTMCRFFAPFLQHACGQARAVREGL